MTIPPRPKIPGWFIALAVLVTATITVWAVLRKRNGPEWPGDPSTLPQRITQVLSPAVAATDPALRQVAAIRPPPVIRAGATPPHGDRGACTTCHVIVDKLGASVPAIRAMSSLPHAYRGGICTNCHQIPAPAAPVAARPSMMAPVAAASPVLPYPLQPAPPALPSLGLARPAPTGEGSWLGLEVVPVTAITAAQYKLPAGQSGVVVAEAEAAAALAGLRPGDLLLAVNGSPVADLPGFQQATLGRTSGTVDVLRGGKILRALVGQSAGAPAGAAVQAAAPAAETPPPIRPY